MKELLTLSGEGLRELRLRLEMTQDQFWGPARVSRPVGSAYELGKSNASERVRFLLWLAHLATDREILEALGRRPTTTTPPGKRTTA